MHKRNRLFTLAAICLLFGGCAAASAQTFYAIYTPEPEAVLANLRITDFGVWSIRVKNNGTTQPNITTTDILGTPEASTVHWVESSLCLSMLTAAQAATPAMRAAQIITIGTGIAGVFGGSGIISMSRAVLGDLAGASLTANYLGTQLKTLAPNISPFANTMMPSPPATISIAPGTDAIYSMCADPTDSATASITYTGAGGALAMRTALVPAKPPVIYRKHGLLGLGTKTLIVVHPPIHATFTVQ